MSSLIFENMSTEVIRVEFEDSRKMKQSEGGDAGAGGDDVFRVRVSLERYFSDERARCYMAAARGRPVRALARRLRRAFGLPRPFALLSRGHLLPPDEPLALLHPDDPIQVIPIKAEADVPGGGPGLRDEPPCSGTALDRTDGADEPAPAEASEADPEQPDLEECKRQALDLLQAYEAPRRRRRGRRRRARAAPPDEQSRPDEELMSERPLPADEERVPERRSPAVDEELAPERRSAAVDEELAPERRSAADEEPTPERRAPACCAVLRIGSSSPRAARPVRPLPADAPPPPPPPPPPPLCRS